MQVAFSSEEAATYSNCRGRPKDQSTAGALGNQLCSSEGNALMDGKNLCVCNNG